MAEEAQQNTAVEEQPKDEQTLMAEMNSAVASGDYKAVAKVAQELVKAQKAKEAEELAAKAAVLDAKVKTVSDTIMKSLTKMVEAGELDMADGVFFNWDFGDKEPSCRLTKAAARKAGSGGGGGAGKKFSISTPTLLETYGAEDYKDGMTFQQAWDSNADKNWRYAIRESLLKKGGYIS